MVRLVADWKVFQVRGRAAAQWRKIDLMMYQSIFACGFAAAQCGKAAPYR
jgi:hypothetical protein